MGKEISQQLNEALATTLATTLPMESHFREAFSTLSHIESSLSQATIHTKCWVFDTTQSRLIHHLDIMG